jgi:hypothetical protein
MPSLPPTAPLEVYQRAAALHDVDVFLDALPGRCLLVRLDERGGLDEPAPWAWHVLANSRDDDDGLDDSDEDDAIDDSDIADELLAHDVKDLLPVGMTAGSDEATATGPAQPPLPIPPAREQATVMVLVDGHRRVGRQVGSQPRIGERSVSRAHALIDVDADAVSVVDLESDNGTAINGMVLVPGTPKELRSGDVIAFADVVFLFLDARAFYSHLPALCGA